MIKKVLIILGIIILVVILGIVLVLGYFGLIPGVSSLFGSDKPRDLGVEYTIEDYQEAKTKNIVELIVNEEEVPPEQSMVIAGSMDAAYTMSDEELTSILGEEQDSWAYYPVSDCQILIGDDGVMQMSGMLHFDRLPGYLAATGGSYTDVQTALDYFKLLPDKMPFYFSSTLSVTDNQVNMGVGAAELGRIKVPQDLYQENAGAVNGFLTDVVSGYPGLYLESVTLDGGELDFVGTLPETVETFTN